MTHRVPLRLSAQVVALTAIAVVTLGQVAQARHEAASIPARRGQALVLSGKVGHLFPGERTVIVVRVRNREPFPLRLKWVGVRIGKLRTGCPKTALVVKPLRAKRRIGARRFIRIRLKVIMKATAPNGCQGMRFPLRFRGRAVRV
jgi:hypothetical protein